MPPEHPVCHGAHRANSSRLDPPPPVRSFRVSSGKRQHRTTVNLVVLVLSIALHSASAHAQSDTDYHVLIDVDGNPATGCSVHPAGGATLSGYEHRLRATLDGDTLTLSGAEVSTCRNGAFEAIESTAGGYPAAFDAGVSGADAIELAAERDALGLRGSARVELAFVADNGSGSDTLTTRNGTSGGAPIALGLPMEIPAMPGFGVFVLALVVVAAAWVAHRRLGQVGAFGTVVLVAAVAWAVDFAADGNLSDWAGTEPAASDPAGDSTDGSMNTDLIAVFVAFENDTLFFRLDVANVENQPPATADETYVLDEDQSFQEPAPGVLDNDTDPEGETLTASLESGPAHADSFGLDSDGAFTYQPAPDFNGSDSFTYSVSDEQNNQATATAHLTVEPVNDPPTFVAGGDVTVDEDSDPYNEIWASDVSPGPDDESGQTLQSDVTADDPSLFASGPDIDATTGELSFTPAADANGSAEVTVVLSDDGGTGNGGDDTSDPATFIITIEPVNDSPQADDVTAATNEDTPAEITMTGSDVDGDDLAFSIASGPANGSLPGTITKVDATTATVEYLPDPDFNGNDGFDYTVDDGNGTSTATVAISITSVNDPPAVLSQNNVIVGPGTSNPGTLEVDLAGDAALDLSYADVEAVTSTGIAFTDFHYRIAVLSIPEAAPFDPVDPQGDELDPFEWSLLDPEGSVSSVQIDPDFDNGDFGYMQWTSSLGQGNDLINGLELTLNAPGEYRVEFVVLDNGRLGTCGGDLEVPPPATADLDDKDIRFTIGRNGDLINGDPDRCNRESRGDIVVTNNAGEPVVVEIAPPD